MGLGALRSDIRQYFKSSAVEIEGDQVSVFIDDAEDEIKWFPKIRRGGRLFFLEYRFFECLDHDGGLTVRRTNLVSEAGLPSNKLPDLERLPLREGTIQFQQPLLIPKNLDRR